MMDEGMFWETNDLKVLQSQFDKYEYALNAVTDASSKMKHIPGETASSLADRIEEMLKREPGNDEDQQEI